MDWLKKRYFLIPLCAVLLGIGLGSGLFVMPGLEARIVEKPMAAADDKLALSSHGLPVLTPEKEHPGINKEVVRYLKYYHYRELPLDDQLSEKVFDKYIKNLDGMKLYFLEGDVQSFEKFRHYLDDALKTGDLQPAYWMYHRYQRRVVERIDYVMKRLENKLKDMDFSIKEYFEIDRENADWPEDMDEQDELWRKKLKNEVLNMKLSGKDLAEIHETLEKRYSYQLDRLKQQSSEDVFRLYMNAYSQTYDPHTNYLSPWLTENFNIMMRLSLEGIGAVLQSSNEYTKIVRLVPAGPAAKSGLLRPGDRIIGVGQGSGSELVDVVGWRLDEVVELIRGPKETVVRLKVIPVDAVDDHQTKTVEITRNTVKLEDQAVKHKVIEKEREGTTYRLGVVEIPTFYMDFKAYQEGRKDYRSTTRDVKVALQKLQKEGVDGVVIDLRENGGGLLQEAYKVTGLFIEDGPIVQVRDDQGYVRAIDDPDPDIVYDGPLVVLINRISASASEIFAGAIQDYHRGIVIGSQTFGKGTVQTLERLRKGQLKLTNGKFYRVSGESTQNRGVLPDIDLPSIYDMKKIGESALPDALPWDKIRSAKYNAYPDLNGKIEKLRILHQNRVREDVGYTYLTAGIQSIKEAEKKTKVSLMETARKEERDKSDMERFQLENLRRNAQGLPPFKDMAEFKAHDEQEAKALEEGKEEEDRFDPLLTESENILVDFIAISTKALAKS